MMVQDEGETDKINHKMALVAMYGGVRTSFGHFQFQLTLLALWCRRYRVINNGRLFFSV
jgi:hypothetical protein